MRTPREVEGDLYAMASCNDVGGNQLLEFMHEFGLDSIDPLSEAIIDRSERAMRERPSLGCPTASTSTRCTRDGFEEPVLLKATVTVNGDELSVDHTGSSPQSRYGINVVMNYTHAYTSFAVKCAISPDVPHNEGSFRPVTVTAPEGCILNAQHPAPVAARHLIGHFLPGLIFGALAQAMPERIMADGAASIWITMFRGQRHVPAHDPVHVHAVPVRRHGRAADQGRPEQRRLSERGGRRPGRGDGESDGAGGRAPRGPRLIRPGAGQVPRRLRAVHHVCRSQWRRRGRCPGCTTV